MQKAVVFLNENQPGEVRIRQMNLFPLMDFPNSVLQFKDVSWYENPLRPDSLHQEPILYINEFNLSLHILELIRGDILVEQLMLKNGFIRLEVYPDSAMNFEKALGIILGEKASPVNGSTESEMGIDLNKIELTNIQALYEDQTSGNHVNILIKQLESRLSYLPELIEANVELELDIKELKVQEISIESKDEVVFKSHIVFNPEKRNVQIEPSSLSLAGLELETWGMYDFLEKPEINMAFRANNTGLEVLNFLFLGVLDMDEIEQIGSGSIQLDGIVSGSLEDELPVVRVNGFARGLGFRIKSINRDVNDISFTLSASNGSEADFSEAHIELKDFSASFPEGKIQGDIKAKNLVMPDIEMLLHGELELAGVEQMIKVDKIRSVEGQLGFDARLSGIIDPLSDSFLEKEASVKFSMEGLGLIIENDTFSGVDGTLYMEGNELGARNLKVVYNGSEAELDLKTENVLPYILDFDRDVEVGIVLGSDRILPGNLSGDTLLTSLLGDELKGLHFKAAAGISREELDAFLEGDTLPEFTFTLDSFGIELPVYADISKMSASLTFDTDTLSLHYLKGMIGESEFSFSGRMVNLEALMSGDSGEMLDFDYRLSSPRMRAEDLFRYREGFLLPETYRTEYLEDFHMAGSARFPVESIIYDSVELDFGVELNDMAWQFRYYPMAIDLFRVRMQKKGDELHIHNLEGRIGESNLKLSALIGNYADSTLENLYGNMTVQSDLLDFNQLLNYQLPDEVKEQSVDDSLEAREPPRLNEMDFPDFTFNMDVAELRYGENTLFGLQGSLRSSTQKVLFLDQLLVSGESGGSFLFNGQFNVSNEMAYSLSADMEINDMNIRDLSFKMQSGDEVYTLKDNFAGVVSGSGMAEVYFRPDLKLEMDQTTAMFQVELRDGALINFKALEAAGKYMNNKNLDHVRFNALKNNFTLMDSKITIPLMSVESSVGLILIEGEQALDNSYLYLLRIPPWLVMDAAKSALSRAEDDGKEDEIKQMKMGNFVMMTIWNDGVESGVEKGDHREKYRK